MTIRTAWSFQEKVYESVLTPVFPYPNLFDKNLLLIIMSSGSRTMMFHSECPVLRGMVWGRKVSLGSFRWSPSSFVSVLISSKSQGT